MRNIKGVIVGIIIGVLLVGGISFAANLVTGNVYINPFKIVLNGEEYTPELPILNYAERTYVPLRELATLTDNYVDFRNNSIIINNEKHNNEILFGTWKLNYAEYNNGEKIPSDQFLEDGIGYKLTLNSDYTYEYSNIRGIYAKEEFVGTFEVFDVADDVKGIELTKEWDLTKEYPETIYFYYNDKGEVYIENPGVKYHLYYNKI